jgi:DNA topoisomerase-1
LAGRYRPARYAQFIGIGKPNTMNVVVVESPAKAKTINRYLGSDYRVLASYGHVRDLPSKDGSVKPDQDFEMTWQVDQKASRRINEIAAALKGADRLVLATDPDREGEAISWHVLQVLKRKGVLKNVDIERVVFNAVTRSAVLEAMAHPRKLDEDLIEAYLARRALDYLVGFTLSPVLWRKLPGARSAGRVQSVALRLICEREIEIESFRVREYWTIDAELAAPSGEAFTARLTARDGKKLDRFAIDNAASARAITATIEGRDFSVTMTERKDAKRHPQPPFTTSTLQQEASRKLGFGASRTMQVAQRLYEGVSIAGETVGLITYMRTDGVQIADEAIASCRAVIGSRYGARYVPGAPRLYRVKAKNAQEAHEAIRPTDLARHPGDIASALEPDQARLYDLIWKRTLASQMASAELERTVADIAVTGSDGIDNRFRATGQVIRFDGFLALYQEGSDDSDDDGDARLPALRENDRLGVRAVVPGQHFTEPPPRFTEASLIKRMEELGIGRPSTYAQTLGTLRDRDYVRIEKKRLHPEDKGRLVTAFLESFFNRYVQYDFTADLEEKLDLISSGEIDWKSLLREFWTLLESDVRGIADLRVSQVLDALNDVLGPHIFPHPGDGSDPRKCPACADGRLSLKVGRYGAFIGCSNYPDCRHTRQLVANGNGGENGARPDLEGHSLGTDPDTGLDVTVETGRFGPYIQLGQASNGEKPKRASIPAGEDPETITLERALALVSLPREVGVHPETGQPILAAIGRFGPFVQHERTYANLESVDEVFTVGLNRAVTLIAEKQTRGGRGGPKSLKELGAHPSDGGPVVVMDGRYGPYVKHGSINATLPRGTDPQSVTMATALELIAAKQGAKPKRGRARKAKSSR